MAARLCRLLLPLVVIATTASRAEGGDPLNLVLIVADDLGYSDLGSYGGEIATPALDGLAARGVRFSNFYATPRCSPSRAALLSGLHPHRVGVGHLDRDWGDEAYRGRIRDEVPILPELLRAAGYRSYMTGKWHLAPLAAEGEETEEARAAWPLQRGFDAFWGTLRGSGSHFAPASLRIGNDPAPAVDEGFHYTDAIGEQAAAFLAAHRRDHPRDPFFLYVAFTAPHWPLHAAEADIEQQRGRYDAGWDALRERRLARLVASGLVPPDTRLAARARGIAEWRSVENATWQARRMEVYAAMVAAMDRAVGRVLGQLAALGAAERTVVVFVSDNGASGEEMTGLNRLLPFFVPVPTETAGGEPVRFGDSSDVEPGGPETFAAYGRGWAQLSNTPWAGFKKSAAEGGIAVPLIVSAPSARRGDREGIIHAPGHMVDLLPTILDLLEVDAAPPPHPRAGRSLRPAIESRPPDEPEERTLYWEHEGNRAVRRGNWKLVARWPLPARLYDLSTDRAETDDLAAQHPEIVAQLEAAWREWGAANDVGNWPLVVPGVEPALWAGAALVLVALLVRARRRAAPPPGMDPPPQPGPSAPRGSGAERPIAPR